MKKVYTLLVALVALSFSLNAQELVPTHEEVVPEEAAISIPDVNIETVSLDDQSQLNEPAAVIRKAEGDPKASIYYKKPTGVYYMGMSEKGYTMGTAALLIPYGKQVSYTAVPGATDVTHKWWYPTPGASTATTSTRPTISLTYPETAPTLKNSVRLTGSGDNYTDSVFMSGQYMRVATPYYETATAGRYGFGNVPYGAVFTYNGVAAASNYLTVNGTLQSYWASKIESAYTNPYTDVVTTGLGEYFDKPAAPLTLTGLVVRGNSPSAINCDLKMTVRDYATGNLLAYFIMPQSEIPAPSGHNYVLNFKKMYDANDNPIDELVINQTFCVFYEPTDNTTQFTLLTHRAPKMDNDTYTIRILFSGTRSGTTYTNRIYQPRLAYSSGNGEKACCIYLIGQYEWLQGDVTEYAAPIEGGETAVTVNASAPYQIAGNTTPQWNVTLADGNPLPEWITIAANDTYSGTTYQGTTTLTLTVGAQTPGAAARTAAVKIAWKGEGNEHTVNISQEAAPKLAAGLAYATTEVAKNLGDAAFTNELTNPNNLTVTYSSSDPAVATVNAENGEVTLVGEGTTTITANSAETAEYLAGTASYTLTVTDPTVYVAQIGTTKYASLEEAFAAAQDGETITLLANCAGNGIKVTPAGKFATGLTVDFAGFTYTVDGETVGSTGTETNGFQLLKDNKITFQNGTITSTKAKILVQNYSDLTLSNMTLTLNNPDYTEAYTLSNNNGNTVINGSTINANPAGGFAFDVCRYASYPSVSVTVTGNSQINGNVEVYASNSDPKNGFKLLLESGTLTGDIVLDQTAKNAMESNPEKAEVTKNNTFNQTAPEGYEWQDNGNGTSTLVKSILVLTLNETEDNSGVLDANNGKVADVTIGRSFVNTSYQTLSLPFDLTQAQIEDVFGVSTRVQSFTNAVTDAEENIVLNFEAATDIEAGKPYLILPFNNVENPTFTGVTVSNAAAQTVTGEQADFVANINATEYAANEQQMYLGADNKLYFNNTTATMKGFRAYFMLKGTTPGKTVGFSFDGTPTGITTITGNTNANVDGWYTLDGQKLNAAPTQKGIYINNGRKVVIK